MDNAVALAALGVLGTCVGLMAWVVKRVLGDVAPALQRHADTNLDLQSSVKENTQITRETKNFLINLNGKLEKAVVQKVTEQQVKHQTVVNQDKG